MLELVLNVLLTIQLHLEESVQSVLQIMNLTMKYVSKRFVEMEYLREMKFVMITITILVLGANRTVLGHWMDIYAQTLVRDLIA